MAFAISLVVSIYVCGLSGVVGAGPELLEGVSLGRRVFHVAGRVLA